MVCLSFFATRIGDKKGIGRQIYSAKAYFVIQNTSRSHALRGNEKKITNYSLAKYTPEMALRLSQAFDTTQDLWLNLQKKHDLYHFRFEIIQ